MDRDGLDNLVNPNERSLLSAV